MRDFRDAKAMAGTLRAALAAKGLKITVSESLELIAKAFGVADWNTLSAAVRIFCVRGPRGLTMFRSGRFLGLIRNRLSAQSVSMLMRLLT